MTYYSPSAATAPLPPSRSSHLLRCLFITVLCLAVFSAIGFFTNMSMFVSVKAQLGASRNALAVDQNKAKQKRSARANSVPPIHHHRQHHRDENDDDDGEDDDHNAAVATTAALTEHHRSGGHAVAHADEDDNSKYKLGDQIASVNGILDADTEFFVVQEVDSARWLSRPLDTNVPKSSMKEKIFRVRVKDKNKNKNSKKNSRRVSTAGGPFTMRGHTRMYLTSELNNRVTIDRLWARSFEMWFLHFDDIGTGAGAAGAVFRMQARRNNKYVTVFKDGKSLETVEDSRRKAARWRMFPVVAGCRDEDACWGTDLNRYDAKQHRKRSRPGDSNKLPPPVPLRGPLHDSPDTLPELLRAKFPLFGSPKPLPGSVPADPKNPFDTVLIAERTIRNWASMDGMVPVMFSDDPATLKIVERVNAEVAAHQKRLEAGGCSLSGMPHMKKHHTLIERDKFEIQPRFKQPTYRGLFKRALEMFPDAPAVMYSNGDILFSPTLAQTIRRVASYFEREKKRRGDGQLKGWMIVGQRVNCVVPPDFILRDDAGAADVDDDPQHRYVTCDGLAKMVKRHEQQQQPQKKSQLLPQWVMDVEDFARKGDLFQGNAEDYFVVSRDLFDWDDIPEFIVGGVAFDNWITSKAVRMALRGEAIVVDAVKTITALHQNDADNIKKSHNHPKSRFNLDLAASHGGWTGGYTADAPLATERLPDGTVTIYDKHALLFE